MADMKVTDYAGFQISSSALAFMNPIDVARRARDLILPELLFMDIFPVKNMNSKRYEYEIRSTDAHSSSYKRFPANIELGGEWPMVDFEEITVDYGEFSSKGVQVKFGPEVIENPGLAYNRVDRMLKYLRTWVPESMNTQLVTDITNDFSMTNTDDSTLAELISGITSDIGEETTLGHITGVLDSARYWDEPGADPVQDLLDLIRTFNHQGRSGRYVYRATDVYIGLVASKYLSDFVRNMGGKLQPDAQGVFNFAPIGGYPVSIHMVSNESGWPTTVGDDYIMIIDRNNPAAETYQYFYKSIGSNNGLLNYQFIKDEDSMAIYYRWWFSRETRLVDPRALWVIQVMD